MPSFRVPVCGDCLRNQRLHGRTLGLVVLCMPRADDHCPPSSSRRQSPDPPSIVFDVDWWRRVVFVWRTGGLSMMSSQSRRPLFPVNDGVGRRRGMMDGGHRRRMISSSSQGGNNRIRRERDVHRVQRMRAILPPHRKSCDDDDDNNDNGGVIGNTTIKSKE